MPYYMIDLPPLYTREAYDAFLREVEAMPDPEQRQAYLDALKRVLVPPQSRTRGQPEVSPSPASPRTPRKNSGKSKQR